MSKPSHHLADRIFVFASASAVIAAGIVGFLLIGSPTEQRLISLDTERVEDLQNISRQLWNQTGQGIENQFQPLPGVLPRAEQRQETYLDPQTGEPYEYRRVSDTEYELCATFSQASEAGENNQYRYNLEWDHPAGFHCYRFDAANNTPLPAD